MGRIHIRKITLQAFRAFKEKNSTKTLPKSGLIGIRGNSPDGVSSGAGKSSLGLAITYALGYCPFPASAQQNWHTKTPMQVELELDTPQGPAVLKRGKEFSLTINEVTTQGSAKMVESELQKLIGIPTELLEALTYRQQQERGRFLKMTDGKKREFLSTLLGVNELEEQIAESIKKSNDLQKEAEALDKVTLALQSVLVEPKVLELKDTQMLKQEVSERLVNYNSELLKLDLFRENIKYIPPPNEAEQIKQKLDECNKRILTLEAKEKTYKQEINLKCKEIRDQVFNLDLLNAQKTAHLRNIQLLELENLKLSESKCNTCLRPWENAEAKLLLNEEKIRNLRREIEEIDAKQTSKNSLILELNNLQNELTEYKAPNLNVIREIKLELNKQLGFELKKILEAEKDYENKLLIEKNKVDLSLSEYNSAKRALELIESENAATRLNWELVSKKYLKDKEAVESYRTQKSEKQQKAHEEFDYADSLRKYLTSLFNQVLDEISFEANEYLKGLSNTPTTTISFTTETQTEKNGVKQEIKPVLLKSGVQIDLKSGISGGQLESVELAIDLAIGKVIGERTGVRPGFIIFDESFSAHCATVKQSCLEILKRASEECLIFVIDHATEFKDYFDDFIDVYSENDESRIVNL